MNVEKDMKFEVDELHFSKGAWLQRTAVRLLGEHSFSACEGDVCLEI